MFCLVVCRTLIVSFGSGFRGDVMSEYIEIVGGSPLHGTVVVGGAKNAGLPILMSTLLTGEECVLTNVPNLTDTSLCLHLLEHFGSTVSYDGNTVRVRTETLLATEAFLVLFLREAVPRVLRFRGEISSELDR